MNYDEISFLQATYYIVGFANGGMNDGNSTMGARYGAKVAQG